MKYAEWGNCWITRVEVDVNLNVYYWHLSKRDLHVTVNA